MAREARAEVRLVRVFQHYFGRGYFCPKCGNIMRLHRDSRCSWLTYYVCRTKGCGMGFTRVSRLDQLGWDEVVRILESPALIEAQLKGMEKNDDGTQKRIRLELFRKKEAERKISRIQNDFLSDEPVITRAEATNKIGELRAVVEKTDAEIDRLRASPRLPKNLRKQ